MATVADVIAALEKLELNAVDGDWSNDIWENEFTSCPDDLPGEFGDKFSPLSCCSISEVIEQADKIINSWLNENASSSATQVVGSVLQTDPESTNSSTSSQMGISWTSLQDIDYKKLLAVLYFYISKGQLYNQDVTSVHTCLKATNFYFTLLMIPGSNIYKVFNLTLFEKCLETFSLYKYLEIATGRKIKKTKPKRNENVSEEDDEALDIDETLTLSQQESVLKQLNFLLCTFKQLVNKFNFKKYPEAVNLSMKHMAELTRIERTSSLQDFYAITSTSSFAPLSRNAYLTMKDLCDSRHGRAPENIRLALFYIMPNLTSIGGSVAPELNKYNQKELNNIRSVAVSFITDNIIPFGTAANLGLKILIQQICFNMVDRADYRSKATEMILTIVAKLSMNMYYTIVMWIFRLSMMEGAHHRVIGIELLSKLLYMKPGTVELSVMTGSEIHDSLSGISDQHASTSQVTETTEFTSSITQAGVVSFSHPVQYVPIAYRRVMLSIIVDRIRDEAAIVRTRALSVMGELLSNKTSPTVKLLLDEIFVNPYLDKDIISDTDSGEEGKFLKWKAFVASLDKVREKEVRKKMIPGARAIVKKIFEKCVDDRVNVRKAALQVIMKIFMFSSKWMTNKNLELYGRHCRDPALSIRKDMVFCVTELLLFFPDHDHLTKLWVKEVVPQITDREIRVQEQALQVFTNVILSKIVTFENTNTPTDKLPWKLLDFIAKEKMRTFLVTACSFWKKSGHLSQNLVKIIRTHIGTIHDGPAWVLISAISEYLDIESPQFVLSHYHNRVSKINGDLGILNLSLLTLNNSWHKLDRTSQELLEKVMYKNLESYSVPATLMKYTVDIATALTVCLAQDDIAGKKEVAKRAADIIEKAEHHLQDCSKTSGTEVVQCNHCITALSLLGNLSVICPKKINIATLKFLHDLVMNRRNEDNPHLRKLQAIVIITLSKMALGNDFFARSLVSSLSELLNTSKDPIILNNVIVSIADIGERYASLIEPLISSMCVCLRNKQKSVRDIALILLIELLQEDYLKARGALVFHLLTLVNDEDPNTTNMVKYYFTNCLIARHPYKMYELLVPSFFHFNNYTRHPGYPAVEMSEAEKEAFDLSGEHNHRRRMNIYQFMLSNVPDMVRMKCAHFICTVVLNGAADNIISIKSAKGEQVVLDALSALLMKEIRIEYNELVQRNNEDGEEDIEQRQNPLYKLGKQMFTAAQKKEIIETIIPICCKLKKKLQQENTKLLPLLHKFVRELVKDYKDEIKEIFKEDSQFGIEILHEIEKVASDEDVEEEEDVEIAENQNMDRIDFVPVRMSEVANEQRINIQSTGGIPETIVAREQNEIVAPETEEILAAEPSSLEAEKEHDNSNMRGSDNADIPLKEAVVYLERLSVKECGIAEDDQHDEVKKAVEDIAHQEEALKRLSITLERLSSKYLKLLETDKDSSTASSKSPPRVEKKPKLGNLRVSLERLDEDYLTKEMGASNRKLKLEDEAMKRSAAKAVMAHSNKTNSRKDKRKSQDSEKTTPNTPDQSSTKYLLTSTPMMPSDSLVFPDISPVIDDSDDGNGNDNDKKPGRNC